MGFAIAFSLYALVVGAQDVNGLPELETRYYQFESPYIPDVNAVHRNGESEAPQAELMPVLWRVVPFVIDPDTKRLQSFMRFNPDTYQLVVHHTPEQHKRIEQLLSLLYPSTPEE